MTINGRLTADHFSPQEAPASRRVAILGKAPDSLAQAPLQDKSWELWGLSNVYEMVPGLARSYELHDAETGLGRWHPKYIEWLQSGHADFPVYMLQPDTRFPHCQVFPGPDIMAHFRAFNPPGHKLYVNNSVSWMILHALYEGVQELGLWGVNMAQSGPGEKSEFAHQRPSCEYWLGVAAGMGVKVHLPAESDLLKVGALYGYETHGAMRTKFDARHLELSERFKQTEKEISQKQAEVTQAKHRLCMLQGAIENLEYVKQWVTDDGIALGLPYSNSKDKEGQPCAVAH